MFTPAWIPAKGELALSTSSSSIHCFQFSYSGIRLQHALHDMLCCMHDNFDIRSSTFFALCPWDYWLRNHLYFDFEVNYYDAPKVVDNENLI